MSDRRVSLLDETAQEAAYAMLTLAFAADPCERWRCPGATRYLTWCPRFLKAFGGGAFAAGAAWGLDDFAVAGLWLPPGIAPDGDAIVDVLTAADRHAPPGGVRPLLSHL